MSKQFKLHIYHNHITRTGSFSNLSERQALRASILKWKLVVKAYKRNKNSNHVGDGSVGTCALCYLYLGHCRGRCPVAISSGKGGCRGTPYDKLSGSQPREHNFKLAKQELWFLRRLLWKSILTRYSRYGRINYEQF